MQHFDTNDDLMWLVLLSVFLKSRGVYVCAWKNHKAPDK